MDDRAITLALLVGLLAGFLVTVVAIPIMKRRLRDRTPPGIVHRLRKPGSRHLVRIRGVTAAAEGTWNPAKPWSGKNSLYGPGEGTYWIGDDGRVNLDWEPKYGQRQHLAGPLPEPEALDTPVRRKARRLRRLVTAAYIAFAVGGFALGFGLSAGTADHRLLVAAFAAAAGYVAAYLVLMMTVGVTAARRANRSTTASE